MIDEGNFLIYNRRNSGKGIGKVERMLLNVGRNNFVVASRILSIVTWEASAIKKSVQNAKDNDLVINATCGKKTRSVIFLDNGRVVLSSVQPETLALRMTNSKVVKDV